MLMFFKQIYRVGILDGSKCDTVRRNRLPQVGSVVQACVGPSRIFAALRITAVESLGDLPAWRAAQVVACYGAIEPGMSLIRFELLHEIRHPESHSDNRQAVLALGPAA